MAERRDSRLDAGVIDEDKEHPEVQAKLTIFSQPGDEYEQEAYRVSGQVMRMSEPRQTTPLVVSVTARDSPVQTKSAGTELEAVPAKADRSQARAEQGTRQSVAGACAP